MAVSETSRSFPKPSDPGHSLNAQLKSLSTIMNDLKFAFRQLLKNPGFTTVAVLTLALGMGINTAFFTAFNALALRPQQVKDPGTIVTVLSGYGQFSYPAAGSGGNDGGRRSYLS